MWSSGATLLALLLVFVRPALGDACVLTGGSLYQLKSDAVDWTMRTDSGQSCIRGLRHNRVTIDTAKLISPPQSGQVKLLGSGFSYTAKSDFEGQDSFTIQVSGMLNGIRGSSDIRIIVSVGPNVSPQTSPTERSDRPPGDLSSAAQPNQNPTAQGTNQIRQVRPVASGTLETPGPSATLYANPYYTCTANRYVSATGNAGNNGLTAGTPWDIVTASNYAAPAGTCINLAPGVYSTQGGIVYKQRGNRTVKDRLCRLVVYHDAVLILERSSTGRGNRVRHQT